jgi:molybdopterin synthase sulfur carrier subunit
MVRVEVRLYAALQKCNLKTGESQAVVLGDNSRLADLFKELKIPGEEVKQTFVNGKREEESYMLRDGDRIGIFPPIGGG